MWFLLFVGSNQKNKKEKNKEKKISKDVGGVEANIRIKIFIRPTNN